MGNGRRDPRRARNQVDTREDGSVQTDEEGSVAEMHYDDRMGDSDALLWIIESDPMLRSTITAVVLLDERPDPVRVRAMFERGVTVIPRFRQRVRANPLSIAPPRWEDDPNFDLDYHLRFVRAPEPGDLGSVLAIAQPIAMAAFDRERPLWEATVIDGLADGGAAIIVKIHHTITDGVGAMQLALIMFDLTREAEPGRPQDVPSAAVMGQWQRWFDAMTYERRRAIEATRHGAPAVAAGVLSTVQSMITNPLGVSRDVAHTVRSAYRMTAPDPTPLSPVMVDRSLSVRFSTFHVPLDEAKAVAQTHDLTLNDVFLGAVIGGMARYHEASGAPVEQLRFTVPINLRDDETEDVAGNHVMLARVIVPVGSVEPVARMRRIHDLVADLRAEPALGIGEPLAGLLRRLPSSVGTSMFGGVLRGSDLITTNVPGSPVPLYSAGAKVERLVAFAPLLGAAVNLSLISYCGQMNIGVNMDPAAVSDRELLVRCLKEGWDEVLATA